MKAHSGFTLVELMITLAVGIIVMSIGVPAFLNMVSTNQAAGYANDLVGAMRLARSEAIKRGGTATVCASNADQSACSSNDWNNGWIVFSDDNGDGSIDAGEQVHRVWSIPAGERADLIFQGASPNSVRFDPSGGNAANIQTQVVFRKNDCLGNEARQITISITGRPVLDHVACF